MSKYRALEKRSNARSFLPRSPAYRTWKVERERHWVLHNNPHCGLLQTQSVLQTCKYSLKQKPVTVRTELKLPNYNITDAAAYG